jgi:multiple sugar transport system ATP-binding protein
MGGIRLEDVNKVYEGDVHAVKGIDLSIEDGEFVVLVGPSGCGKSTLLRMVAGLEDISAGELWIGDEEVSGRSPGERDIAMVFQNYALYPHMTVQSNLAYGLKLRKTPKPQVTEQVGGVAGILGLEELLARRPGALSGGQRQRVAMGRAMVRRPQAFLMDEPLSNLDAKLRVSMRAELSRLHERLGVTTLYVTHDQVEAMTLGDRVAVLRDGLLQQFDTPQRLFNAPRNVFVAGFIGSPAINLAPAVVRGGHVEAAGFRVPLRGGVAAGLSEGQSVVAGIRPHDLVVAGAGDHGVTVRAEVVEELGSERNVVFRVDAPVLSSDIIGSGKQVSQEESGRLLADDRGALWTASFAGRALIAEGQELRLAVDPEGLRLFDADTGAALDREVVPA